MSFAISAPAAALGGRAILGGASLPRSNAAPARAPGGRGTPTTKAFLGGLFNGAGVTKQVRSTRLPARHGAAVSRKVDGGLGGGRWG
jgi:hypothetical protein